MIITRTILNMSYKVIDRYNNKKPKTIEFQLLCKDSDKFEDITYFEHICNFSFKSSIYFKHLLYQNKFSVRKMHTKTIEQVFNELNQICSIVTNYQFELTKLFDLEFPLSYEKKIVKCYVSSDDIFFNQIASVSNKYHFHYLRREDDIINYYIDKRLKFHRKSKMLKLENYINENDELNNSK